MLDLSGLDEPRIEFGDEPTVEQAPTKESSTGVERIYADGFLIDLTPSPLREVCFEDPGASCRWGSSNSANACCLCGNVHNGGVSCGDARLRESCECSPSGDSLWYGALGPCESSFFQSCHEGCRTTCATCVGGSREFLGELWRDYQDFYSLRGLAIVGAQVGAAAVLANTSLDEDFQDWHDDHIKSSGSDDLADAVRWLGDGRIMIPVFAGAALLDCLAQEDQPVLQGIGNWGNRCSRSVLVGGPTVLGLAYLLGASRPCEGRGSSWKIFDDNNSVSGHAFLGATPFLNGARMTESLPLKVAFYGLSTLPAWSRVNDQRHYLSQVLLGWGIAWLAADVVDRTERAEGNWVVVPYAGEEGVGFQSVVAF